MVCRVRFRRAPRQREARRKALDHAFKVRPFHFFSAIGEYPLSPKNRSSTMATASRRIVTGHDAEGKSVVIIDGPATPFGAYWLTDSTPVENTGSADAGQKVNMLEPPAGGSIFRFAAIPPENPNQSREERERQTAKMFDQMKASHCRPDTSRHPGMHKTRTIDYIVLLSGEVTLLLDKGEVDLKPYDVVVQRGTNHAWVNKGKEPAVLAAVLIDAKDVQAR
jgi:mannose-6-phosphate isomerase-like protein (cupin superfamily)